MKRQGEQAAAEAEASTSGTLPELRPWREAGWIFRDGGCVAIERQGEETHSRARAD